VELWLVGQEEWAAGAGWDRVRRFAQGQGLLPVVEVRDGEEWIWSPGSLTPEALAGAWLAEGGRVPAVIVTDDRALAQAAAARGATVWTAAGWRHHAGSHGSCKCGAREDASPANR